ncbi:MAG: transcriptional repressor [Planctomycetota bacterium]
MSKRNTRQRRAIEEVFQSSDRPLSTQEVLAAAQNQKPGLGIATVYRTLKGLLDNGALTVVKLPGEPPRYELAGKPHHHHFYCRRCGRVYEVAGKPSVLDSLVPPGFRLEEHDLVLFGRCRACVRGEPART